MAVALKIGLAVAALAAALGLAHVLYKPATTPAPQTAPMPQTDTISLRIGSTTIAAEVAATPGERAQGLGGRASLADGSGMWFVFKEDGLWRFWMKDTLIALDIAWVAQDGRIITIAHRVEPDSYPQSFGPSAPARYVLELPGGYAKKHGIREGDRVEF